MAFDGLMVHALCDAINSTLAGGRVDRISQPERDEILINIRSDKNYRLLLSANPQCARFQLTQSTKENPAVAPNFCMLLRKHLQPSRLIKAEQPGFERVLILSFECQTELYDITVRKLVVEIMGRFSNIIFLDDKDMILDAVKQVDYTTSSKRLVLPTMKYELPPAQNKLSLYEDDFTALDFTSDNRADKYLTDRYQGFSPLLSRELVYGATGQTDRILSEFTPLQRDKLIFALKRISERLRNGDYAPCVIFADKPLEYYCFPITQYGSALVKSYACVSDALDAFYTEKDEQEHIRRISSDIFHILSNAQARLVKKTEAQRAELAECEKAVVYRETGDLITANIYKLSHGQRSALLTDYTTDPPCEREVKLNPSFSPSQNAQRYYKLYKKALTAKKILNEQIPESERELRYLDSVFEELVRAKTAADVEEIRSELTESGYVKQKTLAKQSKKPKIYAPKLTTVTTDDGYTIYVGKNNLQNDYLTLRIAYGRDMWFHVKDYPGSHVVAVTKGEPLPDSVLNEAALLAAKNSKAGTGALVAVDYTEVRNVKKPRGAKPGMVIYETYKTAYVRL